MSEIIELNNISKHYGAVVGVDNVDLIVNDGEFLTLLGPSGCGKSTLLRMIGGFETPTTGTIKLANEDVTHVSAQKRDVNMMFQDYALFPHMSVGENIAYGLKMKGIKGSAAQEKVKDALNLVGLFEKVDQRPNQLSGGQKQRIALARAVVREPKVLLLDEPLSALDANLREQMQVELKHMHDKLGITFIMVTHDQTEALVMSDRIIVLQDGNISQDGTPEDLYERPETPYVANFIGTTNFLPAKKLSEKSKKIRVEVAGEKITIKRAPSFESGMPLQVGIRPEKIRMLRANDVSTTNTLSGTVREHIYHGVGLRTIIRLKNGSNVLVDSMLPQGMQYSEHPAPGQDVKLAIEPHNIFLFQAPAT